MPDKVLVYLRFPKAQVVRFGERYELLDATACGRTKRSRRINSPTSAR